MQDIKTNILVLAEEYNCAKNGKSDEKEKKQNACVDKLYILVYYHPRFFGIQMSKDQTSDFLAQLYPAFFQKVFERYDKTKSNFLTFLTVCIKNQMGFFVHKNVQETMDETVLIKQLQAEHLQFIDSSGLQECSQEKDVQGMEMLENEGNIYEYERNENDDEMKEKLKIWMSDKSISTEEKYKRRAVFILLCKSAFYIDDDMLSVINSYLKMPPHLLYYYMERFAQEFTYCNKEVKSAETKKTKYFIRYLHTAHLLQLDTTTDYEKKVLEKRLNFSLKHYMIACNFVKERLKSVSNRTIAMITGLSRSCVDRVCLNAQSLLEGIVI